MYVCLCQAITHKQVRQLGLYGVDTPKGLIGALGLDDEECWGFCRHHTDRRAAITTGTVR